MIYGKKANSRFDSVIMNNIFPESKLSQITIFIVITLMIIVIIIVIFVSNIEKNKELEIQPINDFVQNCLIKNGEESIYLIGKTGGYVIPSEPSIEQSIAYYLYDNKNYMPSKEKIESEISSYVDILLPFCINGFEDFPEYMIIENNLKTNTKIKDDKIVLNLDYPLSITKGANTYQIDRFTAEVPVRIGIIYIAITEAMNNHMERTDSICASCLYDIGEKFDLHFHVLDTNDTESLMIIVRDENSRILDEDYKFDYAIKLDLGENES